MTPSPSMLPKNAKCCAERFGAKSESICKPKNSKPKPMIASPKFCFFRRLKNVKKYPIPKAGNAMALKLKLKSTRVTIHAVAVVPMFAPKITAIACGNESSSAFTNEIAITLVAPDD